MRLRSVCLLGAAFALTAVSVASAQITLNISLVYEGSWNADHTLSTVLPNVSIPGADGTSLSQVDVTSGSVYTNHQFGIYASVTGLAADQDLASLLFYGAPSAGVSLGTYTANSYTIDPGPMGSPASDAPTADWALSNMFNASESSYFVDVQTGRTGGTNNTFGDYAAYMQLGEAGSANAPGPFRLGQQILTSSGLSTFNFSFLANSEIARYFQVINGNVNGAASSVSAYSGPDYTGLTDSALFVARGPADVTWANGTGTSPVWAAADGNQHWVQTGTSTRSDFYHLDTVHFTSNAAADRTVTLSGTLNPAAVVVNSSDNYVFTGTGKIVGEGTTLEKNGAGTLTINSTGVNTYDGQTTLKAGTLVLATPGAQNPVLNLGGVDIQAGVLQLAYAVPGDNPASAVDALMKASCNGGAWSGGKFVSTTAAAAGMSLGWFDSGTTVDVKIAVPGDVNLDGTVDFTDYTILLGNYGQAGVAAIWGAGDINYDSVVDFTDYTILLGNYGQSLPPEFAGARLGAAAGHAVPEPSTFALLAAGLIGLAAFAARKRK
jgi:autotransporter-associated beta strand protein